MDTITTSPTTVTKAATIAVVDENVWRVRHLSEVLQTQGHRVVLLTSSANALTLLSDGRCDVVLAVEALQGLTGSALCGALREKLGAKRPWFVLLSDAAPDASIAAAFDVCIQRPITDEGLMAVTSDAITARRASTTEPVAILA